MELIPPELASDLGLIRKIIFASVFLPKDFPNYWSTIAKFASVTSENPQATEENVKVMVENLQVFNDHAFCSDKQLLSEFLSFSPSDGKPIGIVLISNATTCKFCGGKLLLKKDRPSRVTIYTQTLGTVVGSHFHKYCQNFRRGCNFRQFYGYHSSGSQLLYDQDWDELDYLVSTSETVFEMSMLSAFDVELLIGQISYKQKTDIYNLTNKYLVPPKKCSCTDSKQKM